MINSMLKIKQKEYLAKRKVDVERIFQLRRYADAADLVAKMDKDGQRSTRQRAFGAIMPVITTKMVRSAKDKVCCQCDKPIRAGERHWADVVGDVARSRQHSNCVDHEIATVKEYEEWQHDFDGADE